MRNLHVLEQEIIDIIKVIYYPFIVSKSLHCFNLSVLAQISL